MRRSQWWIHPPIGVATVVNDLAETHRLLGDQPLAAPASLIAMPLRKEKFYNEHDHESIRRPRSS